MQTVMGWWDILRRVGQKAGPYLILEMLLPGGTLMALLLFLYRRRKSAIGGNAQGTVAGVTRRLAGVFEQRILIPMPIRLHPQSSTTMRSES